MRQFRTPVHLGERTFQLTPEHAVPRPVVVAGIAQTLSGMDWFVDHKHRKAQLILTLSGFIFCEIDHEVWGVPPNCAIWLPSGLRHSVRGSGDLRICCVFIEPDAMYPSPPNVCRITVSPLLREMILFAASIPEMYDQNGPDGRILQVLIDLLSTSRIDTLNLPMPRDARLCRMADAMISDPSSRLTIAEWSSFIGMSERTLTRLLRKETGMSFGRWRQQVHVLIALQRLSEGYSVQAVAFDLGYEGSSAFITMFRKVLGKSSMRYMIEHGRNGGACED